MRDIKVVAYVLVETATSNVEELREKIINKHNKTIKAVHQLIGPADMICYIEAKNYKEFYDALNKDIRSLIGVGGIKKTETILRIDPNKKFYSEKRISSDERFLQLNPKQYEDEYIPENQPKSESAWLFIKISISDPMLVIKDLEKIKGICIAHPVIGRYDIIAYIIGDTWKDIMNTLDNKVRGIKEISHTDTRLILMKKVFF